MDARSASSARPVSTAGRRRSGIAVVLCAAALSMSSCAQFSPAIQAYTAQPSLTAPAVTPVLPEPPAPGTEPVSPQPGRPGTPGGSTPAPHSSPVDPCVPTDPIVIAACLSAPWGLAPLPDGSALVGERITGRILKVAAGARPVLVATVPGIDSEGTGGLLGIAVSPSYLEDGLIYAYVTTATDNRVVRLAPGDRPKPIFTGIPSGTTGNGGALGFSPQGTLYVGTGVPRPGSRAGASGASGGPLAGALLRIDEFGRPAGGNPTPTSPVFAGGFTQITGLCLLPTGVMAAVDHRPGADVLIAAKAGKSYAALSSGDAVWTWRAGDGGAADCASTDGLLANTSPAGQQLVGVSMSPTGTFAGAPRVLVDHRYGRLLTVEPGQNGALWITTSNRDGSGRPVPSDDRVLLLPDAAAAGGNGPD